jgi:hypothetical protein
MDMAKARWTKVCERCKRPITIGAQFTTYAGRPWHPACVIAYRQKAANDRIRPRSVQTLER